MDTRMLAAVVFTTGSTPACAALWKPFAASCRALIRAAAAARCSPARWLGWGCLAPRAYRSRSFSSLRGMCVAMALDLLLDLTNGGFGQVQLRGDLRRGEAALHVERDLPGLRADAQVLHGLRGSPFGRVLPTGRTVPLLDDLHKGLVVDVLLLD